MRAWRWFFGHSIELLIALPEQVAPVGRAKPPAWEVAVYLWLHQLREHQQPSWWAQGHLEASLEAAAMYAAAGLDHSPAGPG